MLARYIVIIIYGLDKFLEKTSFFYFLIKRTITVIITLKAIVKLSNVAMSLMKKIFIAILLLKQRRNTIPI